MTKKKMMMAGMSAALVAVIGVGGTLAYLSAQSDSVMNTFTVGSGFVPGPDGKGAIKLDESKVDFNFDSREEVVDPDNRVTTNAYPDLLPGDMRTKDPTISLTVGSPESYIFIRMEGADALAAKGVYLYDENAEGLDPGFTGNGFNSDGEWTKVEDLGDSEDAGIDGIYRRNETVDFRTVEGKLKGDYETVDTLFDKIVFSDAVDMNTFEPEQELGKLIIKSVAVQAANVDPDTALEEAKNVAQW